MSCYFEQWNNSNVAKVCYNYLCKGFQNYWYFLLVMERICLLKSILVIFQKSKIYLEGKTTAKRIKDLQYFNFKPINSRSFDAIYLVDISTEI